MQKVLDVFGNQHKPGTHTGWVKSLLSWPAHKSPSSDSVCRNPLFLLSTLHTRVLTAQPSVWPLIYWPSSWDSYAFCCSSQLSYNRFSKIVSHGFYFFQIPPGNPLSSKPSTLRCRYAKITLGSYFLASALQGTLAQISIPFIYDQGQHTRGHIWKDVKTEYILHRRDKKSQYGLKYSE